MQPREREEVSDIAGLGRRPDVSGPSEVTRKFNPRRDISQEIWEGGLSAIRNPETSPFSRARMAFYMRLIDPERFAKRGVDILHPTILYNSIIEGINRGRVSGQLLAYAKTLYPQLPRDLYGLEVRRALDAIGRLEAGLDYRFPIIVDIDGPTHILERRILSRAHFSSESIDEITDPELPEPTKQLAAALLVDIHPDLITLFPFTPKDRAKRLNELRNLEQAGEAEEYINQAFRLTMIELTAKRMKFSEESGVTFLYPDVSEEESKPSLPDDDPTPELRPAAQTLYVSTRHAKSRERKNGNPTPQPV